MFARSIATAASALLISAAVGACGSATGPDASTAVSRSPTEG